MPTTTLSFDSRRRAASSHDPDFEIAEPSRIVMLHMFGTGSGPVITRAAYAAVASDAATSTMGDFLSEETDEQLLEPEFRRRSTAPLIVMALGVAAISAAILAFFVLSKSGNSGDPLGATPDTRVGVPGNIEELGFRHDHQVVRSRAETTDDATPVTTCMTRDFRPIRRTPGENPQTRTVSSEGTRSAVARQVPGQSPDDASRPLDPDEVQRMATRSQSGFVRCYERARRKDPFLQLESLKVMLTVGTGGRVGNVMLSSHQDTALGGCLKSAVERWSFRASRGGITTEIGLKFER